MKRTDRLTIFIAMLLFVALAAYIGVYSYESLGNRTVTAEAHATSVAVDGTASGIVLRHEQLLSSSELYLDVSVADGERVPAGGTLALAMSSETGLERANRMHELELEISRVSALLGVAGRANDLTVRDRQLRQSMLELTGAVVRGDFDRLDMAAASLGSMVFIDGSGVSQQQLQALQTELDSLKNSSSSDTTALLAPHSGTFSSGADGWEHLSVEQLADLTPQGVQAMIDSKESLPSGCYGKLVTGYEWYFAAVMSSVDAAHLKEGRYATLDFGKYYATPIYAVVDHISSDDDDGNVAVVFRCDTALADTLAMRQVSAQVIFEEYNGIRIPTQAIRTDDASQSTYVWVITAMQLERKDVEIIYAGKGFCLVKREANADALREGNTVVVEGRDLYEGKLME